MSVQNQRIKWRLRISRQICAPLHWSPCWWRLAGPVTLIELTSNSMRTTALPGPSGASADRRKASSVPTLANYAMTPTDCVHRHWQRAAVCAN